MLLTPRSPQVKELLCDMLRVEWRLGFPSLHATFKSLCKSGVDAYLRMYVFYTLSQQHSIPKKSCH